MGVIVSGGDLVSVRGNVLGAASGGPTPPIPPTPQPPPFCIRVRFDRPVTHGQILDGMNIEVTERHRLEWLPVDQAGTIWDEHVIAWNRIPDETHTPGVLEWFRPTVDGEPISFSIIGYSDSFSRTGSDLGVYFNSYLCRGCTGLRAFLPSIEFWAFVGHTNIDYMFAGCTNLVYVAPFIFHDDAILDDLDHAFEDCSSLKYIYPLLNDWRIYKLDYTFSGCTSLTNIPLLGDHIGQVQSSRSAFAHCESIKSLNGIAASFYPGQYYVDFWDPTGMFDGCVNVESGILEMYSAIRNTRPHEHTFRNCGINTETGRAELAQIPDDWK